VQRLLCGIEDQFKLAIAMPQDFEYGPLANDDRSAVATKNGAIRVLLQDRADDFDRPLPLR
jgi:hypothetical protein